jgi:lipopolysaccharide heptosyltransferase II
VKPNPERILILRLSSIGDIILSSFFIRLVAQSFPNSKIDFVIKEQFADLIKYNPNLNHVYYVKPEQGYAQLYQLRNELKNNKYNMVFDLHNNLRTRFLLTGLSKSKTWRIKKNKTVRALLVWFKINGYKEIKSIPIRYLETGKEVGINDDMNGLELFWDNQTEEKLIKEYPFLENDRYIALAPGAAHYTKKWPIEYFMELVDIITEKRNERLVILGGLTDVDDGMELELNDRVINLTGKLSLLESAIAIKNAKVLVSNDSGVMHMATAVKTPVLAIFGSTVEELGFFPFRSKHCVIQNEGLKCRPCSHIGKNYCPKGHFRCMLEIKPKFVYDELVNLI